MAVSCRRRLFRLTTPRTVTKDEKPGITTTISDHGREIPLDDLAPGDRHGQRSRKTYLWTLGWWVCGLSSLDPDQSAHRTSSHLSKPQTPGLECYQLPEQTEPDLTTPRVPVSGWRSRRRVLALGLNVSETANCRKALGRTEAQNAQRQAVQKF